MSDANDAGLHAPGKQEIGANETGTALRAGQTFAGYRLIRELGRGGMSVVWLADRADGSVKREVALKLPLLVLNSLVDVDRFDREKDALAALTHPNIARLYDAGVTPSGQPFMVLEAVEGVPITTYCDREETDIPGRLVLFRQVLAAVVHAHNHLIVHRDLKPSNVLVDATGQVKLLDFGIAKILDARALPENGALTVTAASLMTPEYASPEQFLGDAITTATDVYSLGCVLYELLTGHRPLRLASRRPHEIAQAVLHTDPLKPSAAVGRETVIRKPSQSGHNAEPEEEQEEFDPFDEYALDALRRRLRGDLDNIVMKAIRKEPEARYASVSQFSEDLRRHLNAEPVLARKSTVGYLASKFIARNKLMVGAMALLLISIGVGMGLTLYQARIARANELRADQRFNDVRHLANSMLFEIHDSIAQVSGATEARRLLILRAQEYLEKLTWDTSSDSELLREYAAAHTRLATVQGNPSNANLGDTRAAIDNYGKAIELLEFLAVREPSNVATARDLALNYTRLAMAQARVDDTNGRRSNIEKALTILEPLAVNNPGNQDIDRYLAFAYTEYATVYRNSNDPTRALEFFRKAQSGYQRLHQAFPDQRVFEQNLAHSHRHIGTVLALQKQFPEALEHYKIASAMNATMLERNPQNVEAQFNVSLSDSNIGFVLGEQGDIDGALGYYRKALAIRTSLVKADPLDERARTGLSETFNYLGVNLARKKDYPAALKAFEESLATRQVLARNNPEDETHSFELAWIDANIGQTYARMAFAPHTAHDKQLSYCREARERIQRVLPKWIEGQTQVKLGVGGEKELSELKRAVDDCNGILTVRKAGS